MKNLLAASLLLVSISVSANAAPPMFSAFAAGDNLVVTVLGDCNEYYGALDVAGVCRSDRLTRNLAPECQAHLRVSTTRMACPMNASIQPKVLVMSLQDEKVADEAKVLNLTYKGQTIQVQLR